MEGAKIVGVIEQRVSKSGNPYTCIVFKLTDTYEKIVFLKNLELELLKTYTNSK